MCVVIGVLSAIIKKDFGRFDGVSIITAEEMESYQKTMGDDGALKGIDPFESMLWFLTTNGYVEGFDSLKDLREKFPSQKEISAIFGAQQENKGQE